jgi:hypothetical protein
MIDWIIEGVHGPELSVLSLIYSVLGIELTLYWNHIRDVYTINTTGQLIPFVIGLAGLAKVIYEPIKMVRYFTIGYRFQTCTTDKDNRHITRAMTS